MDKKFTEPTLEEMVRSIYQNVVWHDCVDCKKRFCDKGGFKRCFDCNQAKKNDEPIPIADTVLEF